MSHSYTNLLYHFIFATKCRGRLIDEEVRPGLYGQFGRWLKEKGGILLESGGMPDHVHLLAKLRPTHNVAEILCDLKSGTTGWVKRHFEHLGHFGWQVGYG